MGRKLAYAFAALLTCVHCGYAFTDSTLVAAFAQMVKPSVDTGAVYSIKNISIEQRDAKLQLDSGTIYFFTPVNLDHIPSPYAVLFEGRGRFQFQPMTSMERNQLGRFFNSDSLNRKFSRALIFVDSSTINRIRTNGIRISRDVSHSTHLAINDFQNFIADDEQKFFLFSVLKNTAFPRKQGFLMVSTELENADDVLYTFDPYEREEVSFAKRTSRPGYGIFIERICSYSVYADESHATINGIDRDPIIPVHYDIDGTISRKGIFTGWSRLATKIAMGPTQLALFTLYDSLTVDSILDSTGSKVSFLNFKKKSHQDGGVYVIFPRPLVAGEAPIFTFYYHGDIAEKELGMFFVEAGAFWYPRVGFARPATFDMRFRSPADYSFCAAGKELERRTVKDTLFTHYTVTRPASNVSFNIGLFSKYSFGDTASPPVDVYFSEDLHDDLAKELARDLVRTGSHMERQVGNDVVGAVKLFSYYFGAQPSERIVVSEILANYSEAFPGFVHLGYNTWINTDAWGYDRILRAHEVAHQWWGVGVGYATYRDQWLSEGFAEYSALMYLQAVAGNKPFLDRLNDYRGDIFTGDGNQVTDKFESAPVALGYRNASTETPGNYSLIVYRKGAYILHMLRNLMIDFGTMNEDRFFNMMKDYYATYRDTSISTATFQAMVEKHVGADMNWFFDEWVYHSYLPTYDFTYETAGIDSAGCKIMLHIKQKDVPPNFKMYIPVEIEFAKGKAYVRVLVDGPQIDQPLELPENPKKLTLNPFNSVLAKVNQ